MKTPSPENGRGLFIIVKTSKVHRRQPTTWPEKFTEKFLANVGVNFLAIPGVAHKSGRQKIEEMDRAAKSFRPK